MVTRAPFEITLYDRDFALVGWIGDPTQVTVNVRHNAQPTATFSIPNDHVRALQLISEGARAVIAYRGVQVTSGRLRVDGNGDPDGVLTAELTDDWEFFTSGGLGFQAPNAPVTDQTSAQFDTQTGPAETVLKYYAQKVINRTGQPISVAPDLGRGDTITVSMRMNSLADQLFPAVDLAGLGTRVWQSGPGLRLDVYEPAWYPLPLTPGSGIVQSWSWVRNPPTVTRAVAGGGGDGVARVFRGYVDTAAEALWGVVRETFVDASDAALPSDVSARAQEAVAAGAATVGLSLKLAETDTFRYGDVLRVGDLTTTRLVPGAPFTTDVLREAVLTWDVDNGFSAEPLIGEQTDNADRVFARAIAGLARAYSRLAARK